MRETLGGGGGTQYCNTVRKIGKYRNTVWKIDEIQIPRLDPFIIDQANLKSYPDLRWLFISNMYAPYVPVFGYLLDSR